MQIKLASKIEAINSQSKKLLSVILGAVILASCGTTLPTEIPDSFKTNPVSYKGQTKGEPRSLLVVLRYPSLVDPSARSLVEQRYHSNCMGCFIQLQQKFDVTDAVNEAFVKTTYYAMELYKELKARFPKHSVALLPTKVVARNGHLELMAAHEVPPTVVMLDFFTYVDPRRLSPLASTYGRNIVPFVNIKTAPLGYPHTGGMVVTTGDAMWPRLANTFNPALGIKGGASYNFINYLDEGPADLQQPAFFRPQGLVIDRPLKRRHVLQFPVINFAQRDAAILRQAGAGSLSGNSAAKPLMQILGDVIVEAVNIVDHRLATRIDDIAYIARFDKSLSGRWPRWPVSRADRQKLALIQRFQKLERQFLQLKDTMFVSDLYEKEFGRTMRQRIQAELNHQKTAENINEEATAMIVFTGLAGIMSGQSTIPQMQQIANQAQTSIKKLNFQFTSHFDSVLKEQVEFTVKTTEGIQKIKARSLAELRAKARSIYDRINRRTAAVSNLVNSQVNKHGWIATKPSGCLYKTAEYQNEIAVGKLSMHWSGGCKNGVVHGYGAKISYLDEHFAVYMEGEFSEGTENGPMFGYFPKNEKELPLNWAFHRSDWKGHMRLVTWEGYSHEGDFPPGKNPSRLLFQNLANEEFYNYKGTVNHTTPPNFANFMKKIEAAREFRNKF